MSNKAAGALTAKAKAMFGKRIRTEDYQAMLQKKTVAEVASYLKNDTYFNEVLAGINEKSIHRGQLEALIRQDLFQRFSSLMRYANSPKGGFYRYGIIENEIHQILNCIRSFESKDYMQFIEKMPTYLELQTSFKISDLAKVRSFDELLDVISHTDYAPIVRQFKTVHGEDFDFTGCESALRNYYFDTVLKIIDSDFSGKEKEDLRDIFLTQIELENITKIYRLKKYFETPSNRIKELISPVHLRFSKKDLDYIIDNCSADELFDYLSKSAYKNYTDNQRFIYIEYHTKKINYNINRRHLAFSNNPDIVLLSYMLLSETEVQNIVDIIEGIRYRIAPEKIERLLIY
ncbi:V0D/AC39 family V-type ATPase subunit [Anaerorhabdus sp.]|uniref:V0D/AC39 family V-type ATPase subunit n=1 Tax=Anaerorhabdus sp. TaxID=1872524 RepID=UPI002FCC65E9